MGIGGIGEIAVSDTALGDGSKFTPPASEYTAKGAGWVALYKLAGDVKDSADHGGSPGYDGAIVGNPTFGPVKFGHGLPVVSEADCIS